VAEHAVSLEHRIQLQNTSILFINPRYMERIELRGIWKMASA
jgi:hypothetical protein